MARAALLALILLAPTTAPADETSATDKLRILYSTRFTFTDDGLPLVTVEIMSNQKRVELRAKGGLVVRPEGIGDPGALLQGDQLVVGRGR